MYGVARKDRPVIYRCADKRTDAVPRCHAPSLDADKLESQVWSTLAALLASPDRLADYAGPAFDHSGATVIENSASAITLERRIGRIQQALGERIAHLYAQGKSGAVISATTRALDAELAKLSAQHSKVVAWERANHDMRDRAGRIAELAVSAQRTLANLTSAQRRRIIELLDVRVGVTGHQKCPTCNGKGIILDPYAPVRDNWNGKGSPATCPSCRRLRTLPRLAVTGCVPDATSLGAEGTGSIGIWRIVS